MTDRSRGVDWEATARSMGLIGPDGERSSSRDAQRAVAVVLGESILRDAVDWCVDGRRGCELAEGVRRLLVPDAARARCLEIYRADPDVKRRSGAIWLLRVIATEDDFPFVVECLADADEGVQNGGVGVLEWLLWRGEIDGDDAEPYLQTGEHHPSPYVREKCAAIREYIRRHDTFQV